MMDRIAARLGVPLTVIIVAVLLFSAVALGLTKCAPRHDPLPERLARTDEKATRAAAEVVGQQHDTAQHDANINIDLVTKEVRDAFDAIPAVPVSTPAEPRALPAAPVDRLRDRLNESVARANRAAGAADKAD